METMEIEISTTTKKRVRVSLPLFRKCGNHYYKVYSKERCIQVYESNWGGSIGDCHAGLAWASSGEDINKEDFDAALDRTKNILINQ